MLAKLANSVSPRATSESNGRASSESDGGGGPASGPAPRATPSAEGEGEDQTGVGLPELLPRAPSALASGMGGVGLSESVDEEEGAATLGGEGTVGKGSSGSMQPRFSSVSTYPGGADGLDEEASSRLSSRDARDETSDAAQGTADADHVAVDIRST